MSIILFLVILLVLVLVHEFGHFIIAKKSGVRVDEFGFGFPPKLFSFKKGETTYSFNALPFGGFVKIFGENPDENSLNGPDSSRSLVHKPKRVQAAILAAGVIFNIILAWIFFSTTFLFGLPVAADSIVPEKLKDKSLMIMNVLKGSPADLANLEAGDKIMGLHDSEGNILTLFDLKVETVQNFINAHPDQDVFLKIKRKEKEFEIKIKPEAGVIEDKIGIGISLNTVGILKLNLGQALWAGAKKTGQTFVGTFFSLGRLIKDSFMGQADFSSITGPVGIVAVVGQAYQFGFIYLLFFTALISINLAVINIIPFPALDGGRLLFLLIEKIKGSPIKPVIANTLNFIGFILLLALMIVVTYNDIIKLIG